MHALCSKPKRVVCVETITLSTNSTKQHKIKQLVQLSYSNMYLCQSYPSVVYKTSSFHRDAFEFLELFRAENSRLELWLY